MPRHFPCTSTFTPSVASRDRLCPSHTAVGAGLTWGPEAPLPLRAALGASWGVNSLLTHAVGILSRVTVRLTESGTVAAGMVSTSPHPGLVRGSVTSPSPRERSCSGRRQAAAGPWPHHGCAAAPHPRAGPGVLVIQKLPPGGSLTTPPCPSGPRTHVVQGEGCAEDPLPQQLVGPKQAFPLVAVRGLGQDLEQLGVAGMALVTCHVTAGQGHPGPPVLGLSPQTASRGLLVTMARVHPALPRVTGSHSSQGWRSFSRLVDGRPWLGRSAHGSRVWM